MSVEKIEVYTTINNTNTIISDHSVDQALERFNLKQTDRRKVADWIRSKLRHAEFASTINSERYSIGRLFKNKNIGIVLDIHKDTVVTVYPIEAKRNVKEKVVNYIQQELHKTSRRYKRKKRKYEILMAQFRIEKSELELKLLRARSDKTMDKLRQQIREINSKMSKMTEELSVLENEKSELEVSLIDYSNQ